MNRWNNRGRLGAIKVLKESGVFNTPSLISIEDLAYSRGVSHIQQIRIDGAQGRITGTPKNTIISYNEKITLKTKKRFVIAHELGHYELHKNLLINKYPHIDTTKSLSNWYAKGIHEVEANDFAAEILMPSHLFRTHVKGQNFNFNLIRDVASIFETSLTASLLKYRKLGDFPIAIIFSEKKEVKWSSFSCDFLCQYIPKGMNVPIYSVAYEFYEGRTLPFEPEEISALTWFCEDRNLEAFKDVIFYEQCVQIGENGVLSCIWND